jgi:hypothetical protein
LGKHTRGDYKEKYHQASAKFNHNELATDVKAGTDAISHFLDADWWTWKRGSTIFFWHWVDGEQR